MAANPWIRFFPSDWLAGTRGMTAAESGIYITLIAMMYERGGGVPNDPARLARLCGASNSAFRKALDTLLSEGKLTDEDGLLVNNRVVEELSYSREKQDLARQAAESRWGKKPNKNNDGSDADAKRAQSDGNAIQNQNQKKKSSVRKRKSYPEDFEAFWRAYPDTTNNTKANAAREWERLAGEDREAAVAGLSAYAAHCRKTETKFLHAERYLKNRRWESFAPEPAENPDLMALPDGRVGEAIRDVAHYHGKAAANAWFGKCELNGTRIRAPTEFHATHIRNKFGQFLEGVEIEAVQ